MHNYELNSLKKYARELRAHVRSALPEGVVILCDKGDALYFVRLPKRNCCSGEQTIEDNLRCESSNEIRLEEALKRELMQIGFDCAFSNGALLISPRAELMIEFERRFAPRGFLSRSLERFRGANTAGRNADSKVVSMGETRRENFSNNSIKAGRPADARAIPAGEARCTNRQNSFAEEPSPADSGVSAGKICCDALKNSSVKTDGYADLCGKRASLAGILLFSEGLKRIEQPEPSKVKTYSRRVREFAAVCLRTGCGVGCYACARIAEEIERWV